MVGPSDRVSCHCDSEAEAYGAEAISSVGSYPMMWGIVQRETGDFHLERPRVTCIDGGVLYGAPADTELHNPRTSAQNETASLPSETRFSYEAEGTRTLNLRIDSPML